MILTKERHQMSYQNSRILRFGRLVTVLLLSWFVVSFANAAEPKTVKFGLTPVFDYQPWAIAHELGMDKELGINIEMINITSAGNGVAAMRQGSLDVTSIAQVAAFPFYKAIPTLRTWVILNQYKGFIVVGRKGKTETFDSLVGSLGPQKAKERILQSMKGKSFAIYGTNFQSLVKAALSQVGLTLNDVKLVEFPDDPKAALAFESGVGDFFLGTLPQEAKLLAQSDRYINVGGHEILGPAGLWYSSMVGLEPWLTNNKDTVMKLLAIWYRVSRYINERSDVIIPIWTRIIDERAAASFSVAQVKTITGLMWFPNTADAKAKVFSPDSELYWRRSMDYYVAQNKDKLPDDFGGDKYNYEQVYFEELLKNAALMQWIQAPLK
jgi:ABC-type nitrate/sulfonate/bicarbonate transport system substrate-binding protein